MRRVLVTGGSGFIGTNLVAYYLDRGVQVVNLDSKPPCAPGHSHAWRRVDVLDAEALATAIEDFDPTQVVHLAAQTALHESATAGFYAANTVGVKHLIAALRRARSLRRVIFTSSMLVCRLGYRPTDDRDYCPTTQYGRSKVQGESIVRALGEVPYAWTLVRPTSIWGPWFGPPYRPFFEHVARGRFVLPRDRAARRTFGYVGNTVRQIDALLLAPALEVNRRMLYLGDNPPLDIAQWARLIAAEFGAPTPREVPFAALAVVAKMGDMLQAIGVGCPITTFRLRNMTTDHVADLVDIHRFLPETRIGMHDGVRDTVSWLQSMASRG